MAVEIDHRDISVDLIDDLERRLATAEFYLTGAQETQDVPQEELKTKSSVYARLQSIEEGMERLTAQSRAMKELLRLYKKHSELFDVRNIMPIQVAKDEPSEFSLREQLDIVNSCATLFPSTVSRLNLLKDSPVPPSKDSAELLALGPRLDRSEDWWDLMAEDIEMLRGRTILLKQRAYKICNLSILQCWAEYEDRLLECEKIVRRAEIAKEKENPGIESQRDYLNVIG